MRRRLRTGFSGGISRLHSIVPEFGTKSTLVLQAMRDAIISGQFKPGSTLRQRELSDMFGISETPIREALFQLQAEGLVVRSPHREVVVSDYPVRAVAETYLMRMALEGLAVRLAAKRGSAQDIAQLAEVNELLQDAISRSDRRAIRELNRRFHFLLYSRAEMPRLLSQIQSLWSSFPRGTAERVRGRAEQSAEEHELIIRALRSGDAGEASALTIQHIASGARALAHEITERTGVGVADLDATLEGIFSSLTAMRNGNEG